MKTMQPLVLIALLLITAISFDVNFDCGILGAFAKFPNAIVSLLYVATWTLFLYVCKNNRIVMCITLCWWAVSIFQGGVNLWEIQGGDPTSYSVLVVAFFTGMVSYVPLAGFKFWFTSLQLPHEYYYIVILVCGICGTLYSLMQLLKSKKQLYSTPHEER